LLVSSVDNNSSNGSCVACWYLPDLEKKEIAGSIESQQHALVPQQFLDYRSTTEATARHDIGLLLATATATATILAITRTPSTKTESAAFIKPTNFIQSNSA